MSDSPNPKPHPLHDVLASADPIMDDPMLAPAGSERRMNVRAYNYWASLLGGRNFPSVVDLEPDRIETFRDNSILLDFSRDPERPTMRYVGKSLRDECGLRPGETSPEAIPGRSMLSRLTDHYLEIIANRAPIGFEAEFSNLRGNLTLYRGILLPLSDDNETINFIYGVISWKEMLSEAESGELLLDLQLALREGLSEPVGHGDQTVLDLTEMVAFETETAESDPDDVAGDEADSDGGADGNDGDLLLDLSESAILTPGSGDGAPLDLVDAIEPEDDALPANALSPYLEGDLAEDLEAACAAAEKVKAVDSRSRAALYEALEAAYRFSATARATPAAYARLIEDRGLKMQDRAPFTPVVKLVFGTDYDKTRLTEYAAAMTYAEREGVARGGFKSFVERFEGGLKGLVKAERAMRAKAQGNQKVDAKQAAIAALSARAPIARVPLSIKTDADFVLLVARPSSSGLLEVVELIDGDEKLIEAVVRRSVRGRKPKKGHRG